MTSLRIQESVAKNTIGWNAANDWNKGHPAGKTSSPSRTYADVVNLGNGASRANTERVDQRKALQEKTEQLKQKQEEQAQATKEAQNESPGFWGAIGSFFGVALGGIGGGLFGGLLGLAIGGFKKLDADNTAARRNTELSRDMVEIEKAKQAEKDRSDEAVERARNTKPSRSELFVDAPVMNRAGIVR